MGKITNEMIVNMTWAVGKEQAAAALAAALNKPPAEARAMVDKAVEAWSRDSAAEQALRYIQSFLKTTDGKVFIQSMRDGAVSSITVFSDGRITMRR